MLFGELRQFGFWQVSSESQRAIRQSKSPSRETGTSFLFFAGTPDARYCAVGTQECSGALSSTPASSVVTRNRTSPAFLPGLASTVRMY